VFHCCFAHLLPSRDIKIFLMKICNTQSSPGSAAVFLLSRGLHQVVVSFIGRSNGRSSLAMGATCVTGARQSVMSPPTSQVHAEHFECEGRAVDSTGFKIDIEAISKDDLDLHHQPPMEGAAKSIIMNFVIENPDKSEDDKDTPHQVAPVAFGTCLEHTTPDMSYAARALEGHGVTQHSTEEEWMLGQIELPYLSEQLESLGVLLSPSEVKLRESLCTTNKSDVYKAEWNGKDAVAKMAKVALSGEDAAEVTEISKKELIHEIKILCKLSHPSLLQFVGACIDPNKDSHCLLTEYCQAGDVEQYMQQQREQTHSIYVPPNRLALQWAFSTADALGFLHNLDCPIIHRDVKPLNLLLTKALELKLSDLGMSKVFPSQSRGCSRPAPKMSGGVGTWRYMAPEVVRFQTYTDRADVYSFSLILVFVFSGKQPFHEFAEDDPELILKAYLKGQEPRPGLTDTVGTSELRELIRNSWHTDAASRPSATECAWRLAEMLQFMPARKPLRPKAVQSPIRKRKRSPAPEQSSEHWKRGIAA